MFLPHYEKIFISCTLHFLPLFFQLSFSTFLRPRSIDSSSTSYPYYAQSYTHLSGDYTPFPESYPRYPQIYARLTHIFTDFYTIFKIRLIMPFERYFPCPAPFLQVINKISARFAARFSPLNSPFRSYAALFCHQKTSPPARRRREGSRCRLDVLIEPQVGIGEDVRLLALSVAVVTDRGDHRAVVGT